MKTYEEEVISEVTVIYYKQICVLENTESRYFKQKSFAVFCV